MTEIPEHLLKRSAAARQKAEGGGDGGDGGDATDASSTPAAPSAAPAVAASPTPAVAEEAPPPPPKSPMVEAHESRRKIPWWATAVAAFIPLWAYIYVGTLEPPPEGETVAVLGEEDYATACAGCHGAGGGGVSGPGFTDGAIYATWPDFVGHYEWVRLGSSGYETAGFSTYGANDKPIGGGMPGFAAATLPDYELIAIILHERELGGEPPTEEAAADLELLREVADYLFEHREDTLLDALEEVGYEGPLPELVFAGEV